jgi:1,4-alpha-glucan branching enzyme
MSNTGKAPMTKAELTKLLDTCLTDPFSVRGKRPAGRGKVVVRALIPNAEQVSIAEGNKVMERIEGSDIFEWHGLSKDLPTHYRLLWRDRNGHEHIAHDPYTFKPQVADFDMHLFAEGKHWHAQNFLGAHVHEVNGIPGSRFAVWAPNALRVSVVGNFNEWDGRAHPMRKHDAGIWELFIPGVDAGTIYKYEIYSRVNKSLFLKSDPYGRQFELRPKTASIVAAKSDYPWGDKDWLEKRAAKDWLHEPMSVYEMHLGAWRRGPEGEFLDYKEAARQLVDYVKDMGFNYIELMPITEHPFDGSWGYQTTGYFAPTSRYGTPDEFRYFVDYCHQHDIGILLDWVPAHFPKDAHGLARFDGTALYEHEDPRKGEHLDWETLIYNFGRHEVKTFLLSSALFWLQEYHLDGLRVDAVASMLYLDYSRTEWIPNEHGGRENLEAIEFLRELNEVCHKEAPGALVVAEESTSWPQVTRPVWVGGLGFSLKWNMGWMNDSLSYMEKDMIYRKYHHDSLTFSMLYAFNENFMLPFSHDEVVHGKKSMLNKMPGDEWQKFANLRTLYTYMFTHPGKKLLFMGTEFAQGNEWNNAQALDWWMLEYGLHQGVQNLVRDLNQLYHNTPALYHFEFEWQGFEWIDCHDAEQSILSYIRKDDDDFVAVILNFTPVPRYDYRIGVPRQGQYKEIFNSDSSYYGGSNVGNGERELRADNEEWMGRPYSLVVNLPPLAGIVLQRIPEPEDKRVVAEETTIDENKALGKQFPNVKK